MTAASVAGEDCVVSCESTCVNVSTLMYPCCDVAVESNFVDVVAAECAICDHDLIVYVMVMVI